MGERGAGTGRGREAAGGEGEELGVGVCLWRPMAEKVKIDIIPAV